MQLDQDTRSKVEQIKKGIADLEREANNNINNDDTKVEVKECELDGLSPQFIETLEFSKEGHRFISMKTPEVMPALRLCKNESVRKKLHFAYSTRC